jgi:hypothetical protein
MYKKNCVIKSQSILAYGNKVLRILLYLLIIILTLTSALALQVNQTDMSVTVVKDETSNYCINVKNTDSRTLYNVTMTNFPNQKIDWLLFNQTANLCFNVTRSDVGNIYFNPIVYGNYKITYLADPVHYKISLIDFKNYSMRINDQVELCNYYNESHQIKESANAWQYVLTSGQCMNITGLTYTQEVQDTTSGITGYFLFNTNIVEQFARDNSLDTVFNIFITTVYPSSRFKIIKLLDNYTVPYGQDTIGILQIKNDERAVQGATLSIDWGTFDTPIINLASNETKFVQFKIRPNMTRNVETNKSYSLNVKVALTGFKESNDTINVFVPYFNIERSNDTTESCVRVRAMTKEEATAFFKYTTEGKNVINWYCFESDPNGTRPECLRTEKVYINLDLNETLAQLKTSVDSGFDRCQNSISTMKNEDIARLFNTTEDIKMFCQNVSNDVVNPLNYVVEQDKTRKSEAKLWTVLFWVIICIIAVLIGVVAIMRMGYKRRKELMMHGVQIKKLEES